MGKLFKSLSGISNLLKRSGIHFLNKKADTKMCFFANQYYYYYLDGDYDEIPVKYKKHIDRCVHCKAELPELKRIQADEDDVAASFTFSQRLANLENHQKYLCRPVSCNTVKSFMPIELTEFKALHETPVTMHIKHCKECLYAFQKLSSMQLSETQLINLSKFCQEQRRDIKVGSMKKFANTIVSLINFSFRGTDSEMLKQICLSSKLRKVLYTVREHEIERLKEGDWMDYFDFDCFDYLQYFKISMESLFGYVCPYGIDPHNIRQQNHTASLPPYSRQSLFCMKLAQKCHNFIYGFYQRPDTTVTIFEPAKTAAGRLNLVMLKTVG